jgi:hypothetical protein
MPAKGVDQIHALYLGGYSGSVKNTVVTLQWVQPPAPATSASLALSEGCNAFRQIAHDAAPVCGRHAKPMGNFTARPPTADAKPCLRFYHADFHTGCFDVWKAHVIHGCPPLSGKVPDGAGGEASHHR